jgi:Domain of unknown function (DUF4384)
LPAVHERGFMPRQLLWIAALLLLFSPSAAPAADSTPTSLISIVLEKKSGDAAQTVDPAHVFDTGDIVRFRLQPSVDAYLYVLDMNTSGKYDVLFPRAETGSDNRIEHGREYLLPATQDGWFEVAGPAGHEKIYFVMSPLALTTGQLQNAPKNMPPQGTAPSSMRPRCDDGVFKARGECIDSTAGPKQVAPSEKLPRALNEAANGASRDLKFTKKSSASVVTSTGPLAGPVVYEFLLAHN